MIPEIVKNNLNSKSISSHYSNRYLKFIYNCVEKNANDKLTYSENHHILPKSVFPKFKSFKDNQWNCVKLTARQHLIAHWILSKAIGGSMLYAYWGMLNRNRLKHGKVSSIMYENSRLQVSNTLKEYYQTDEGKHELQKRTKASHKTKLANGTYLKISDTYKEYAQTAEGKEDYKKRGQAAHITKLENGAYLKIGKCTKLRMNSIDEESGLTIATLNSRRIDRYSHNDKLGCSISEYMSKRVAGDNNPSKREDVRVKISSTLKKHFENNAGTFTGKSHTEMSKLKMSLSSRGESNPVTGTLWYNNGEQNLRLPKTENPPSGYVKGRIKNYSTKKVKKLTCPHCNKTGGSGNMMRYHFDNCRLKQ